MQIRFRDKCIQFNYFAFGIFSFYHINIHENFFFLSTSEYKRKNSPVLFRYFSLKCRIVRVMIYYSMDGFINFDSITIIQLFAWQGNANWKKIVVMMILNFNTIEKLRSYLSYKSIKFN